MPLSPQELQFLKVLYVYTQHVSRSATLLVLATLMRVSLSVVAAMAERFETAGVIKPEGERWLLTAVGKRIIQPRVSADDLIKRQAYR